MNLSISNCQGQCYDGASNMSGIRHGVATQFLSDESRALYNHCYGLGYRRYNQTSQTTKGYTRHLL